MYDNGSSNNSKPATDNGFSYQYLAADESQTNKFLVMLKKIKMGVLNW